MDTAETNMALNEDAADGSSLSAAPETIDLRHELRETHAQDVLDQLDRELVGLAPVKPRIRQICALLVVDRVRRRLGLTSETPTLHMSSPAIRARARPPSPCAWRKSCTGSDMSARAISSR